MTELDVLNEMLATMGEAPLNQIDEDHPYVAAGKRFLATSNRRVQGAGWWFNKEVLTLQPDATSKFVYVPLDIISCDADEGYCRYRYIQRGTRLYDLSNGSYEINERTVRVFVIRLIPFEDLPPAAQDAVALDAVLAFQENYDADQQKTVQVTMKAGRAMMQLNSEHTRQVNANYIHNTSVGAKLSVVTPYGSSRLPTFGRRR